MASPDGVPWVQLRGQLCGAAWTPVTNFAGWANTDHCVTLETHLLVPKVSSHVYIVDPAAQTLSSLGD